MMFLFEGPSGRWHVSGRGAVKSMTHFQSSWTVLFRKTILVVNTYLSFAGPSTETTKTSSCFHIQTFREALQSSVTRGGVPFNHEEVEGALASHESPPPQTLRGLG